MAEAEIPKAVDFFGAYQSSVLSGKDKLKLNKAISDMILSSLRPYEIANEPFLKDLITTALEVGARHGNLGSFHFDLRNKNSLISGDGVRKKLDKVYSEITD